MSFIKIFNKDKQSKNSLYESVLAKYEKKHSAIITNTCHLMNAIENNSEFLKSIDCNFKPMNCYLERAIPSKFGHTYNYRIVHGCDYLNSFSCQITTDNDFKLTFVVDLYFPTTIRISAVKTSDTYFDNKKVIFDVIDKSLNMINEILTEELDRIKNIIMQLNLVYKEYPLNPSKVNDDLNDIRKAFLHNIKRLMNYRGFYLVPHEVNLKYNSFYIIDESGQPKEFIEQVAYGETRQFIPSEVKFVSAESFDNYALAINLLTGKYNTTFCLHANFEKIDITDA
jgi:hypothetical protein